jgi:hypothetical protein
MKRTFGFGNRPSGVAVAVMVKATDQFARHEGIGRAAFAVLRQIQQLAVAACVQVEDALDADRIFRRGRSRGGGRRFGGNGWRNFFIHTKRVGDIARLDRTIRRRHFSPAFQFQTPKK